jgi:hypothetical protein
MNPPIERSELGESLRALDPNLPLLASQAAIEVDNILSGKTVALEATQGLALILANSFQERNGTPGVRQMIDPTTTCLMTRAFDASHWGRPITTDSDLAREASDLADIIKTLDLRTAERESLIRIRAFFAALAVSASSYIESTYALRPNHPHRR